MKTIHRPRTDPASIDQKFRMANHDLVYVSNAPLVEAEKVIGIFNSVLVPVGQASGLVADTALVHDVPRSDYGDEISKWVSVKGDPIPVAHASACARGEK